MPTFDLIIQGGMVVDGTRLPRYRTDLGIKNGRIAKIGRLQPHDATKVIDANGLIVAPGFVDLHTHYDAQIYWDPYCSISGWHGVTSAVIGNCGFGFAPVRPEERERSMLTMTRVEAIPYASMKAGMPSNPRMANASSSARAAWCPSLPRSATSWLHGCPTSGSTACS